MMTIINIKGGIGARAYIRFPMIYTFYNTKLLFDMFFKKRTKAHITKKAGTSGHCLKLSHTGDLDAFW